MVVQIIRIVLKGITKDVHTMHSILFLLWHMISFSAKVWICKGLPTAII